MAKGTATVQGPSSLREKEKARVPGPFVEPPAGFEPATPCLQDGWLCRRRGQCLRLSVLEGGWNSPLTSLPVSVLIAAHQLMGAVSVMKFDLSMQQQQPGPATAPGPGNGMYDVMPEAIHHILAEVQLQAGEFGQLAGEADTEMMELADACKAPPISAELSSLYAYVMKRAINIASSRTANAVDAVAQAVAALMQGDDQMSASAREAAAQAAQARADDAPGAADSPRATGRGPAQAF